MGCWNITSWENDAVFDALGLGLSDRLGEISNGRHDIPILEHFTEEDFNKAWEWVNSDDCISGDPHAIAGVILFAISNNYPPKKEYIEKAIESLEATLKDKEEMETWTRSKEREVEILREIETLREFLNREA